MELNLSSEHNTSTALFTRARSWANSVLR